MSDDTLVSRLGEAVVTATRGLDLDVVLQNVVDAAATLLDARYAALGVLGDGAGLREFVYTGFDGDVDRIGHLPRGHGILGLLIDDPQPLRLTDLTAHPRAYGFPPGHPRMTSFVGTPIRVRDQVYGNLYVTSKRDGVFTEADEQLAVALAATAGSAIANAFSYQAVVQRERSLDALHEVTGAIVSGSPDHRVLELIAERARDLLDADLAAICVPVVGPDRAVGDLLEVRAAAGDGAAPLRDTVVRAAGTLSSKVMLAGQLIATDRAPVELGGAHPSAEHMTAGVPLTMRGRTFGALLLSAGTFEPAQVRLATLFAQQASVALDSTAARAEVERLLLVEERERIGRDLHDTVIQRLFATGLELQALAARLGGEPDAADRLSAAVDALDETIVQIRTTIFALQPSGLQRGRAVVPVGRVHEQLMAVVAEAARALSVEPQVVLPGDPESVVATDIAEHILSVVREGLSNVARHADANQVTVELHIDDEIVVRVVDDGVGLSPAAAPRGGMGLSNMRERAESLGGRFAVQPRREGGTLLEWRVRPPAP